MGGTGGPGNGREGKARPGSDPGATSPVGAVLPAGKRGERGEWEKATSVNSEEGEG